jgi:hypothetical protein
MLESMVPTSNEASRDGSDVEMEQSFRNGDSGRASGRPPALRSPRLSEPKPESASGGAGLE